MKSPHLTAAFLLVAAILVILTIAGCATSFEPLVDGVNGVVDGLNRFTNSTWFGD